MNRRTKVAVTATIALVALAFAALSGAATRPGGSESVHLPRGYKQQCVSADIAPRNPVNPLDTAGFTGNNPLAGAHLFVENPWLYGGDAADTIAHEVGLGSLAHQYGGFPTPWAAFKAQVNSMNLSAATRSRVDELEKIGDYPQAHQFSIYTAQAARSTPRCRTTCAACT